MSAFFSGAQYSDEVVARIPDFENKYPFKKLGELQQEAADRTDMGAHERGGRYTGLRRLILSAEGLPNHLAAIVAGIVDEIPKVELFNDDKFRQELLQAVPEDIRAHLEGVFDEVFRNSADVRKAKAPRRKGIAVATL